MPFRYGDLQAEMDLINRACIEVMIEGDCKGRVFTFPDPDLQHHAGFPWDSENAAPVRDDCQVRPAVFPELPQLRTRNRMDPQHALPPRNSTCVNCSGAETGLVLALQQTGSLGVVTITTARASVTATRATKGRSVRTPRRAASHIARCAFVPGGGSEGDPAADGRRPVSLHHALLPGHRCVITSSHWRGTASAV